MLKKCTLILSCGDQKNYALRAKNFPLLPIGSEIDLTVSTLVLEEIEIAKYSASQKWGPLVEFKLSVSDMKEIEKHENIFIEWHKDGKKALTEYLYPDIINFSAWW